MSKYQNFIGIDIGKFNFVVALHNGNKIKEYENSYRGLKAFLKDYKAELPTSLIVLECTGGYEMTLLLSLCQKKYAVHQANTRKVKNFIRSFGNGAKTDVLDAKALARYGVERQEYLTLFTPASENAYMLYELVQRRRDLKQILVAEKNRLKAPKISIVKSSVEIMIQTLQDQIQHISEKIKNLIDKDPTYTARLNVLKTIPGIGDITAQDLLALIPELGTLTRRQVASLAGLAPRANDSGKFKGYRETAPGREAVKPILFLSAMAARNSHSPLKEFYERLINKGKKKMVALTALMRKIIVIANAKLKPLSPLTS